MGPENIEVPTFETERLLLTPVTLADSESYQKYVADYEVVRYLAAQFPWPYPDDGAETFIREVILPAQGKNKWVWGLHLKTDPDELIGVVDLWRKGCPENRGFWLGRKFWGQGLMTEAVQPVTRYAFEALGFEALVFSNAAGNIGSLRIKEKTGVRFLRLETAQFVDPELKELEVWSLSKADWLSACEK